jgi:hypothetical protein
MKRNILRMGWSYLHRDGGGLDDFGGGVANYMAAEHAIAGA